MGLDFERLWALLLIPVGVAAVCWIDRRYGLKNRSLKRRVTRAVRCLVISLLALAVAAPSVLLASGAATRWVLLDASDSAKPLRAQMEQKTIQEIAQLPKGQQAGVLAFGADAMVETPVSAAPSFTGLHTQTGGEGTDLDGALRLAAALTSSGAGGITAVTDGKASVSQATMDMLSTQGMKVDVLALAGENGPDAQATELNVPAESRQGQSIPIQVVIDASADMEGTLVLYQNGTPTATRQVSLQKGENRFAFTDTASKTGVVTYGVQINCDADTQPRNNSAFAYVHVLGAPNVALIGESAGVQSLFAAAGMEVTSLTPAEMPLAADGYLSYDAVILNNVDYDSATEKQWQALSAAVTSLGKGLCVLGGDQSYALGGYRGTLLEELLPVTMDVKEKLRMPALSLVICIDKSGSMTSGQFGSTRIEVAKEAAMSAAEVLTAQDNIGVIGFDDTAKWVVPFQNVTDVEAIQNQIGTLRADGGTAFYSALDEAYRVLAAAQTPQKHVIFLSDGQPGDNGFQNIVQAMKSAGITLTTVSVGADADTGLMAQLAALGGGRCYSVGEFDNIPKIFTKETMLVSGSYVQNRTFTPIITESGSLTDFDGFPTLDGYLTCAEKTTATVSLVSDTDEPLLAWWNAGAGKVIAWTSDAEGAWTGSFLQWQQAPAFFGGMVAKVLANEEREGTLTADVANGKLQITYQVENDDALQTQATVLSPDGTETSLPLTETAPGQYQAETSAALEGAYAVYVTQKQGEETIRTQEGGAVRGFSSEYDLRVQPDGSLEKLCQQTGGRMLTMEDSFWNTPIASATARKPLQRLLLIAFLCLFVADVALRKLPWEDWLPKTQTRSAPAKEPVKPKPSVAPKQPPKPKMEEQARQTANALLNAKLAREKK